MCVIQYFAQRNIAMKSQLFYTIFLILSLILGAFSTRSEAEASFQDGWWRTELFGATGIHSGSKDRDDEFMINGTVEYEFPLAQRTTLGLRMMPLFVYTQDDDDKEFLGLTYYDSNDDTVWGGGAGLALRFYTVKGEYRGFYGEIEGQILGHSNEFEGNSSNLNFLTGAGLGYKFAKDVSLFVKYNHISNAGLGDKNSGVNTIGIGLGYDFKRHN